MICLKKTFSLTSCPKRKKTDGSHTNRPFCTARWQKQRWQRRIPLPKMTFFCFFSSKKKRRRPFFLLASKERGRFLFLKKRNKRHCGGGSLSGDRRFPARPARNEKNGRFTYEPSVLYSTLAEATMAKKNTSPENDFLLLLFFLERKEEKRRRKTAHIRSSRRSSASRSSNSRPSSASSASSCAAFAPM